MRRDAKRRTNIFSIQWWIDSAENLDRQAPFAKISLASVKNSWSFAFATLTSCRPLLEVYNWLSTNASSSSRNTAGTARLWSGRIAILTAVISFRKVNEKFQRSHEFINGSHSLLVFSFCSVCIFFKNISTVKSPFHITGYTIYTHSICGKKMIAISDV